MIGDPIKGELHSADASAGVQITIYKSGSLSAYTLAANEYIEVHSLEIVSVPGGDIGLFIGPDSTPAAGEYVVRATVGANSGLVMSRMKYAGINGGLPFVIAPAGVVDVNFRGVIRKGQSEGLRPSWQSSQLSAGA